MALTNSLKPYSSDKPQKVTFTQFIVPKKKNIEEILGKERTIRFISAITSAVATNPAIQECEQISVFSGALLGESLGLAHSPQLGQYYLVPFKKKFKNADGKWEQTTLAQFILGVQGWKQLAIRSGEYETLNVIPVKDGEYKGRDRWSGEPVFEFYENDELRDSKPVVGYLASFRLKNGFSKCLYRTKTDMLKHADRYSQAFSWKGEKTDKYTKVSYEEFLANYEKLKDDRLYSSFWYQDFDTMACGKVLKKLIKEYGILSVDLQSAIDKDDKIINDYENNNGYVEITSSEPKNADISVKADENGEVIEEPAKDDLKGDKTATTDTNAKDNSNKDETHIQESLVDEFFA